MARINKRKSYSARVSAYKKRRVGKPMARAQTKSFTVEVGRIVAHNKANGTAGASSLTGAFVAAQKERNGSAFVTVERNVVPGSGATDGVLYGMGFNVGSVIQSNAKFLGQMHKEYRVKRIRLTMIPDKNLVTDTTVPSTNQIVGASDMPTCWIVTDKQDIDLNDMISLNGTSLTNFLERGAKVYGSRKIIKWDIVNPGVLGIGTSTTVNGTNASADGGRTLYSPWLPFCTNGREQLTDANVAQYLSQVPHYGAKMFVHGATDNVLWGMRVFLKVDLEVRG